MLPLKTKSEKTYNLKLRINPRNFAKLVMAGSESTLLRADIDIHACSPL